MDKTFLTLMFITKLLWTTWQKGVFKIESSLGFLDNISVDLKENISKIIDPIIENIVLLKGMN